MDYRQLDKVRSTAVPLQLDTIEAFAAGRLSRREFIKRATILGLSTGTIGMVIAACGGAASTPSAAASAAGGAPSAAASAAASAGASAAAAGAAGPAGAWAGARAGPWGVPGGVIRIASQKPVSVDPIAMQDLGGYGIT